MVRPAAAFAGEARRIPPGDREVLRRRDRETAEIERLTDQGFVNRPLVRAVTIFVLWATPSGTSRSGSARNAMPTELTSAFGLLAVAC